MSSFRIKKDVPFIEPILSSKILVSFKASKPFHIAILNFLCSFRGKTKIFHNSTISSPIIKAELIAFTFLPFFMKLNLYFFSTHIFGNIRIDYFSSQSVKVFITVGKLMNNCLIISNRSH